MNFDQKYTANFTPEQREVFKTALSVRGGNTTVVQVPGRLRPQVVAILGALQGCEEWTEGAVGTLVGKISGLSKNIKGTLGTQMKEQGLVERRGAPGGYASRIQLTKELKDVARAIRAAETGETEKPPAEVTPDGSTQPPARVEKGGTAEPGWGETGEPEAHGDREMFMAQQAMAAQARSEQLMRALVQSIVSGVRVSAGGDPEVVIRVAHELLRQ